MRLIRSTVAVIVALAVLCALPALALSKAKHHVASPKRGVYIDTKSSFSFRLGKDLKTLSQINGSCFINKQQLSSWSLSKHLTISHGAFAYDGRVTLRSIYGTSKIKFKIRGTLSNGRFKGSFTALDSPQSCDKTTFKTKYYGVNPMG
jgi:hypothetical protein